ncbi:MAG: hypothetical protein QM523_00215 [Candidatus Pacebacteria bacterium]|nr:hypothetical protein [Candidatus Paceibacterota bacterium]
MEIVLKLNVSEVNALLSVLSQLPNQSGTYPLLVKIKEQGEAQIPKVEPIEETA